jgi:LmbE family N-acetylglucosaminyl deacetylase
MQTPSGIVRCATSLAAAVALTVALTLAPRTDAAAQPPSRTLVAVLAHADDEGAVAPVLARYAREGAKVYLLIASDGAAGFGQQGHIPRPDSTPQGEELARVRAEEARCAAQALGAQPPLLLGFPDGKLGDYVGDRSLTYRLTQRMAEELGRLRPDAIVTWGPDGGVGHPDHRMVSNIVTQLARAGAPGVPERVFYMYLPVEGIRAMNPQRGEPPLLIPQAKYFTVRVSFTPEDLAASQRSMVCHKTQLKPEVLQRIFPVQAGAWNGVIALVPAFSTAPATDLFR